VNAPDGGIDEMSIGKGAKCGTGGRRDAGPAGRDAALSAELPPSISG